NTHGEVLLGLGKVADAIKELDRAVELAPAHPRYDEMRWDLAVAYLCADEAGSQLAIQPVANDWTRDARYIRDLKQLAETYLQEIGGHEAVREIQPFTGPPNQLDSDQINLPPACRSTVARGP